IISRVNTTKEKGTTTVFATSNTNSKLGPVRLGALLNALGALLGGARGPADLPGDPVPAEAGLLANLGEEGASGGASAVLIVGPLLAGLGAELVDLGVVGDGLDIPSQSSHAYG